MKRIGIPEGMTLSAVICITKVDTFVHESDIELHIEGFTRGNFGEIYDIDILLAESDESRAIKLLAEFQEGAMFSCRHEPFSIEDDRIKMLYPKLNRWDSELLDLCLEDESEGEMDSDADSKCLELIARKIANRSKRQRHYLYDSDALSPSKKIKGLWTYGQYNYGLQKIFILFPAQSEIPLNELADLLSRVDGKLERAASFRRILCTYGSINNETSNGQESIIRCDSRVGTEEWLATLTLLSEQGQASKPITLTTFRIPCKKAFASSRTIRPTADDPVIIVAPHRDVVVTEKAYKAMRTLHKNLTWVFYDGDLGWSIAPTSYKPQVV